MTTNKRNRKEREKRTHSQRKEGERRGGEQMQERRERRERERERRKGVPPKGHVTHPCEFLLRAEADLDQKKTREGTKGGERGAQRGGERGLTLRRGNGLAHVAGTETTEKEEMENVFGAKRKKVEVRRPGTFFWRL